MKKAVNVCRQKLQVAIAAAKQENWHHFCIEVWDNNIWEAFSKLCQAQKSWRVEDLEVGGRRVVTDGMKAEVLADCFFSPSLLLDLASHHAILGTYLCPSCSGLGGIYSPCANSMMPSGVQGRGKPLGQMGCQMAIWTSVRPF